MMRWLKILKMFFPFNIYPLSITSHEARPCIFSGLFLLINIGSYSYLTLKEMHISISIHSIGYFITNTLLVAMTISSFTHIDEMCRIINTVVEFEEDEGIAKEPSLIMKIIPFYLYVHTGIGALFHQTFFLWWRSVTIMNVMSSLVMTHWIINSVVLKYLVKLSKMEHIPQMREGYNRLATLVNKYNQTSQFQISLYFMSDIVHSVRWFKDMLAGKSIRSKFNSLVKLTGSYSRLMAVCYIGDLVIQQTKLLYENLFSRHFEIMSQNEISEVELFLNQIEHREIRVKAYNMLQFNMALALKANIASGLIISIVLLLEQLRIQNPNDL